MELFGFYREVLILLSSLGSGSGIVLIIVNTKFSLGSGKE